MKFFKTSYIKSEYWLTNTGHEDASGDDNHEMIAEDQILSDLNWDNGYDGGIKTFEEAKNIFQHNLKMGHLDDFIEDQKNKYDEDYEDYLDFDDYILWLNLQEAHPETHPGIQQQVESALRGLKDPRLYAAQYYDWVRVQGNYIQVWDLNRQTTSTIEKEIRDIVNEQQYYNRYDDEEIDEEWMTKPIFKLEILKSNQYFPNVSYLDIVNGEIAKKMSINNIYEDQISQRPTTSPYYKYVGGSKKRIFKR